MFLSAKLILKGNTVDVYFYLQTGMVGLDFEKKKIWTGPGRRQFIILSFGQDRAEKKQNVLISSGNAR
jgi:hypothetical protein